MRSGVRTTQVNVALTKLPSIKGVDWRIFVMNVMVSLVLLLVMKAWFLIPISIAVHLLFVYANKTDPFLTKVITSYGRQGGIYLPGRHFKSKRYDRPNGFGRQCL
jgi:type IV secretory pathway VirB3-like protein